MDNFIADILGAFLYELMSSMDIFTQNTFKIARSEGQKFTIFLGVFPERCLEPSNVKVSDTFPDRQNSRIA